MEEVLITLNMLCTVATEWNKNIEIKVRYLATWMAKPKGYIMYKVLWSKCLLNYS